MAITYQTEGIKMPDIKKRETTEWIKALAARRKGTDPDPPLMKKESVKSPIFSVRTKKYWK